MTVTTNREQIESRIREVHYQGVPGTTTTICSIVIENGFVVSGTSACVDPENFDQEIGENLAYECAFEKLWELEGYLLKEKIFQEGPSECPGCPACEAEKRSAPEIEVHVISLDDLLKKIMH